MWSSARSVAVVMVVVAWGASAQRVASGEPSTAALTRVAMSTGFDASWAAIETLAARGDEASQRAALNACRRWLTRDATQMRSALRRVGDLAALDEAGAALEELRAAAREHVGELTKDAQQLRAAEQYREALIARWSSVGASWRVLDGVLERHTRRAQLLERYRALGGQPTPRGELTEEDEAALGEAVTGLFGDDLRALLRVRDDPFASLRAGGPVRVTDYALALAEDRVRAFHRVVAPRWLEDAEARHLVMLNEYRVALGVAPVEADPRLNAAARRHSRSMRERDFFSHTSPIEGLASPRDRARAAGYPGGGAENIAFGYASARQAFWAWFNSPGHHRNMVGRGHAAIGLGRVGSHWTEMFGSAARLSALPIEEALAVEAEPEGAAGG